MLRDFRWRIAIPYIILILIVMGALTIFLSRVAREAQPDALQADLLAKARTVNNSSRSTLAAGDVEELDQLVEEWADTLQARVTFIDAGGLVLGESDEDRAQMDNHLNRPEVQQALVAGQGSSIRYSNTIGAEMLYAAVPVEGEGGETIGFVRLALPLRQVQANADQLRSAILIAAIIATMAAAVIAVVIANRLTRSVHRLTETSRRMAAGDLDARLYLSSTDDLGDLSRTFNHMADQLRDQVNDLTDERARLAAILENMVDGVLITDRYGQVDLINPAGARLLGVGEAESIGRTFAEVARHHELIELWQRGCSRGQEEVAAVEMNRLGMFIQMIVTPLESAGQQNCLIILQDLTRIRRLETVRRDFISNISHELRTPLASLKALVETLHDSALDDPPAARRFLDRADQEVDALTQMVEELLELTRIESGRVPLRLSPTPVTKVVMPPLERLMPQAERHNLTVSVSLADDLPQVLVDATRIQQVVSNLFHNAIKFTDDDGAINVRAKTNKDKSEVIISLEDTGVGIPSGDLDRIYERFYKTDRARSSGGTGLGLAIARHLVQAHGGRIWAKSRQGHGSTFYFSLPVADNRAA